ncbi:hypothetical protein [Stutzerimonas nitrititolerans]|uniref:hypothetical protein n=1 Tax=Stutzerimonas nitrititolerans TaxID=2482751 RepID=UPI0028B00EA6|nr:hypothetical protein [Stutzerimonas nitrititolerans]
MVEIEAPNLADAPAISALLDALGYPGTEAFIERRIAQLIAHPDEALLVAVDDGEVIGVISLHFIPATGVERRYLSDQLSVRIGASARSRRRRAAGRARGKPGAPARL